MSSPPTAARVDELRQALDDAERTLDEIRRAVEGTHYDQGVTVDEPGSGLAALARVGNDWMRFQVALMTYQGAFTRYMAAMDERRQEHLRALEAAAEERAKKSAEREAEAEKRATESAKLESKVETRAEEAARRDAGADARDRLAQLVAQKETHWIKWATVVIAGAAVLQMIAAGLQACAAFRSAPEQSHAATASSAPAASPIPAARVEPSLMPSGTAAPPPSAPAPRPHPPAALPSR
jgi:ATPase subunit of ABC transporter with duplicated ATPase domains